MKKIEFKNLPDKSTPLSAENMNLMQDNIEEPIKGVNLYENETGTTENITLNENIANYDEVLFEFRTNDNQVFSSRVINNQGIGINTVLVGFQVDTNGHAWIKMRRIEILGQILTNVGYAECVIHDGSVSATDCIYITKITGRKY